jgi:NAD+ kinase
MLHPRRSLQKIAFVASTAAEAQTARERLADRYGDCGVDTADAVVALGGDGLMLQTLHRLMSSGIPIYGMNRGSIGFLMNEYREDELLERLAAAELNTIHPLAMRVTDTNGTKHRALAINEVSLFRQTNQAAKLSVSIDGTMRLEELVCDGALVATPAGSTAYNLSAYGPILPLNARLLALTPISPFRPRRWRGALVPNRAHIRIDVREADKRPVAAVADHTEFRDALVVDVEEDRGQRMQMLFDPGRALDERILSEQFRY